MLYGFGVYRSKKDGGESITAQSVTDASIFDGWMEHIPPFGEKKYAATEDGELLILDMDATTFDKVPEVGKLIVQYGAGDLEDY